MRAAAICRPAHHGHLPLRYSLRFHCIPHFTKDLVRQRIYICVRVYRGNALCQTPRRRLARSERSHFFEEQRLLLRAAHYNRVNMPAYPLHHCVRAGDDPKTQKKGGDIRRKQLATRREIYGAALPGSSSRTYVNRSIRRPQMPQQQPDVCVAKLKNFRR